MKRHILNKSLIYILIMLFSSLYLPAQPQGYKQMSNPVEFKQQLKKTSKTINTIQSDFIQEKYLTVLSDKIVSTGKFFFKKENQLRWEYNSPFNYLIILRNDKVFIKDDQKTNQYDLGSNKVFREINNIMTGAVQGKLLEDEIKYKPSYFENSKYFLVILTPADKNMKDYIKSIYLYFDKKNFTVTMIKMVESSDDYTLIQFNNRKQNISISEDKFTIK
jgi:outer membrane lipoprotein-sorting protein